MGMKPLTHCVTDINLVQNTFKPETFYLTSACALWVWCWEARVLPPQRKQALMGRLGRFWLHASQETLTTVLYQKHLSLSSFFSIYPPTQKVKKLEMDAFGGPKIFPKSEACFSSARLTVTLP